MSVPDFSHVPKKLFATGLYDLKTRDGHDAYVDATVATLNGLDSNFRHLKKSASQTHTHRHGDDSCLYLLPDNRAMAIDFIGGAGGPNPQPGWIVDTATPYKHSDAHDPDDHGLDKPPAPPSPPSQPYPSESPNGGWWGQVFDVEVAARYARVNRPYPDPNDPRSLRWCGRTAFDIRDGLTKEASLAKHLKELEQALGISGG